MDHVGSAGDSSDGNDFEDAQSKPMKVEVAAKPAKCFACSTCASTFKHKGSLGKHILKCESSTKKGRLCYVPGCQRQFYHETKLIAHLEHAHSKDFSMHALKFNSLGEFLQWKEHEQETKFVFFSQQSGITKGGKANYRYYICQHDGAEKSHVLMGKKTSRTHLKGRAKVGDKCPARLLLKQDLLTNEVFVTYIASHSHELNFENTKLQPMSLATKVTCKQKVSLGVPPKQIRDSLRGQLGDRDQRSADLELRKDNFISLRNIKEMERKLKCSKHLHTDDAVSLMLMIKQLQMEPYDPVLIYKPYSGPGEVGCEEMSSLPDFENLFVLGFQTQAQRDCLAAFASKVICIDATHCTNHYGYHLLNIVVPDEYGKGYPVAHFICSRMDEQVLRFCFSSIKSRIPDLVINAVMTDDDNAPWNALLSVFGNGPKHLLCTWHILRAWSRRLRKSTSDPELYREMYTALRIILYTKQKSHFEKLVEAFCRKYMLGLTESFVHYFKSEYLNRPEVWALCYRGFPHGDADTNMLVESFHNRLKTFYMQRKPNRRLDDLLVLLMEIERDDYLRRLKSNVYNETQISNSFSTKSRHDRGMLIPDDQVSVKLENFHSLSEVLDFQPISQAEWTVQSQTRPGEQYTVTLLADVCKSDLCFERCLELSCSGLCAHRYSCDCYDASGLCKHIHKLHSTLIRLEAVHVHLSKISSGIPDNLCANEEQSDNCDTEESFQLHDTPSGPISYARENTNRLAEAVKAKLQKLTVLVESDRVRHLLLPHIDSTLSNLIQQCEAIDACDLSPPSHMHPKETFAPKEKLEKQNIPKTMIRASRKRGKQMLPKITYIEKETVASDLLVFSETSLQGDVTEPQIDEFSSIVPLNTNKSLNRSKLSLPKKQAHGDLTENNPITVPVLYYSEDLLSPLLKITTEPFIYSLGMLHLKSLEHTLPAGVVSCLKMVDRQFSTGWIYDRVIDAYLTRLAREHNHVLNAETVVSLGLLNGSGRQRLWLNVDLSVKNLFFFPCNLTNDHWVLFVANRTNKILTYLDPYGRGPGQKEITMFNLIIELMNSLCDTPPAKWNLSVPDHTKQKDAVNCGVFVMWYAKQLCEFKSLTEYFDPNGFRRTIFQTLAGQCMQRAHHSDNTCRICQNERLYSDWLQCDQCDQWFHCACVGVTLADLKKPSFGFLCP